jgi:hypothetical protein
MKNLSNTSKIGYGVSPLEDFERIFLFWGLSLDKVKKIEQEYELERYGSDIDKWAEKVNYDGGKLYDVFPIHEDLGLNLGYSAAVSFSVFSVPMNICCVATQMDEMAVIRNEYMESFSKYLYKKGIVVSEMLPMRQTDEEEKCFNQALMEEIN